MKDIYNEDEVIDEKEISKLELWDKYLQFLDIDEERRFVKFLEKSDWEIILDNFEEYDEINEVEKKILEDLLCNISPIITEMKEYEFEEKVVIMDLRFHKKERLPVPGKVMILDNEVVLVLKVEKGNEIMGYNIIENFTTLDVSTFYQITIYKEKK